MSLNKNLDSIILVKSKSTPRRAGKIRFDRLSFLKYINGRLDDKKRKSIKLKLIEEDEMKIAQLISNHIKDCIVSPNECTRELAYDKALKILELKKEQLISQKSFWENILSNPTGLGILLIGLGNLLIAGVNLMNQLWK